MLEAEKLAMRLRQRVAEFGKKESYWLDPEELEEGMKAGIFSDVSHPRKPGDGTKITAAVFEENKFICVITD